MLISNFHTSQFGDIKILLFPMLVTSFRKADATYNMKVLSECEVSGSYCGVGLNLVLHDCITTS